jgi:hypothetical protein
VVTDTVVTGIAADMAMVDAEDIRHADWVTDLQDAVVAAL